MTAMERRRHAAEAGLALGLLVSMIIQVLPTKLDYFSTHLWHVGRAAPDGPYSQWLYYGAAWNTWGLWALSLLPREVGLILIWLLNLGVALWVVPRVWGTPAWLVLISPPFVVGMIAGQPFEALFFIGVSLVILGWLKTKSWLIGLGVFLMLFKFQLGLLTAIFVIVCMLKLRRGEILLLPAALVLAITAGDWLITGQFWPVQWWQVMRQLAFFHLINRSLWLSYSLFSPLWIPIGIWLLIHSNWRHPGRELFLVTCSNIILSPYWAGYMLWPIVAMFGCLRNEEVCYDG